MDVLGGEGGIGAEQHGGIDHVLLVGLFRVKVATVWFWALVEKVQVPRTGTVEGPAGPLISCWALMTWVGRVAEVEGALIEGGGVDDLVKGDDDRLSEDYVGLIYGTPLVDPRSES